jgi:alkylresorcinol/alkylpyrone synthase
MTASEPRLLALSTAVPSHVLLPSDVRRRVQEVLGPRSRDIERLAPVFDNTGIVKRHSCLPMGWYEQPHGWGDRNRVYLDTAVALLEQVARDCIAKAGLAPEDIDSIVTVSTTGIATPSLDAILVDRLGLKRHVQRLPIFGLVCAGGVLGLSRAAALARAEPGSRVLVLVVELCTLSCRKDDFSASNIVAIALFGDGAAGAILSTAGEGPRIGATGEHTWPQSLDVMGWEVMEDGLRAIFSRSIPDLVSQEMRSATTAFLERHGLGLGDIGGYVCHPGGTKVLIALEAAFDLPAGSLVEARRVLADYGNMSAVTVLFVLKNLRERDMRRRMLMTALGPGFSAAFAIVDSR